MSSWLAVRNAKHHLFSPLTFSRVDLLAHQQGDCECLKCCHNYKVPAHDADAWTASLYCSATIIQSQSKNSWCAGGLPPKIRAASWNMSKSNFHWQAETTPGAFPHSALSRWRSRLMHKVGTARERGPELEEMRADAQAAAFSDARRNDIHSSAITEENCCLMSRSHVLPSAAPRGPKARLSRDGFTVNGN